TGLTSILGNSLHAGSVVVTSPRGTLGFLQCRTCTGLVEEPGNEHRTVRDVDAVGDEGVLLGDLDVVDGLLESKWLYRSDRNPENFSCDVKQVMYPMAPVLSLLYNVLGLAAHLPTFDKLGTVPLSQACRSRDTEIREKVRESNCELFPHRSARH